MSQERLAVWLGDEPVGDLTREGRRFDLRFRRRTGARAGLTVADAGAADSWTPAFTRAWFDGLLPEEARRGAAEVEHGVERGDTFGLLGAIGWECAGAVSVLPVGRSPASGSYRLLPDEEVWERLDLLPRTFDNGDQEIRLSLGGAQEKLLLARRDGRWHLPLDGAISTHILKPEPDRYPGLAIGEAWALAAASTVTDTAVAEHLAPAGHRPSVIVTRYDRVITDTGIGRTHQEDGCQALGLAPGDKYPRSIGPRVASLARIAGLLVARGADPLAELARLLQQVVVNVALLNTDAHAKNVSVLHAGPGTITLAPLYDVIPTAWFLPTQTQLALPVSGKWRVYEVTRGHLLMEARSWGVPDRVARSTIDETLAVLHDGIAAASERFPGVPAEMVATVRAQLARVSGSPW